MNEMAEILWETSKEHLKSAVENLCRDYEVNPKYKLKKYFESEKLVGFCVYYDMADFRVLEGGFYIGKNKKMALRMWKWLIKDTKVLKILVHKTNIKMIRFLEKMKFTKINDDACGIVFERKV
jgi:RimJ/RimL family protein N-acetyltransferase